MPGQVSCGLCQAESQKAPRDGDVTPPLWVLDPVFHHAPNEEAVPNVHSELLQLQIVAFASCFTTCTAEKSFCNICLCEINFIF